MNNKNQLQIKYWKQSTWSLQISNIPKQRKFTQLIVTIRHNVHLKKIRIPKTFRVAESKDESTFTDNPI